MISWVVDAGQQGTSSVADHDPTPAETPSPSSAGGTLPTAPLASLPINFGSSPNTRGTNGTVVNSGLASASPAANATGPGMQLLPESRAADGKAPAPGPGLAVSPAANMTQSASAHDITVLNTPLSDLPVSFNPGASPAGG